MSAVACAGRKPAQITAVDGFSGGFQDTGKATPFGRALPVDRPHGGNIWIEEDGGDLPLRCSGLHAIPGAQHQRCLMTLEAGQALCAGPLPGREAVEEAVEPHHIANTPEKMLIAGNDEGHAA